MRVNINKYSNFNRIDIYWKWMEYKYPDYDVYSEYDNKNFIDKFMNILDLSINYFYTNLKRKQKTKVKIEEHDLWNLDETLALVIHPAIVAFRKDLTGSPLISKEDAPHLIDLEEGHNLEAWDYVLGKMEYSFNHIANNRWEGVLDEKGEEEIAIGLKLFAKYYQALWT